MSDLGLFHFALSLIANQTRAWRKLHNRQGTCTCKLTCCARQPHQQQEQQPKQISPASPFFSHPFLPPWLLFEGELSANRAQGSSRTGVSLPAISGRATHSPRPNHTISSPSSSSSSSSSPSASQSQSQSQSQLHARLRRSNSNSGSGGAAIGTKRTEPSSPLATSLRAAARNCNIGLATKHDRLRHVRPACSAWVLSYLIVSHQGSFLPCSTMEAV